MNRWLPLKRGDETGWVGPVADGQPGELQADDPALGPVFQRGDIRLGQGQAHHLIQEAIGFAAGKAQIPGPDLGQLVVGPQPGQRQRRVFAGEQDQVQRLGQVGHQLLQDLQDEAILDHLKIVQDQQKPALRIPGCR